MLCIEFYGFASLLIPSGSNVVSRPRPKSQGHFWDIITLLDSSHDSWENEVLFLKIGAMALDLWLDMSSGPKCSKCGFLGPDPKSRYFLRFHDFIGFIWWFLKKWGPLCKNWSQDPGLTAACIFWAHVTQIKFVEPRPQGQDIFWDFMILLDSSHDSSENEVCFWKLELGIWTYGLTRLFGPIGPIVVSRPQTPRSRKFLWFHDLIRFISWFLRKWGHVCENWC